jgi:hypothetical protein
MSSITAKSSGDPTRSQLAEPLPGPRWAEIAPADRRVREIPRRRGRFRGDRPRRPRLPAALGIADHVEKRQERCNGRSAFVRATTEGAAVTELFGQQMQNLAPATTHVTRFLVALTVAGLLGAALGVVRPVRRGIAPRSLHVVHAQILLSIVGAMIMVIVAESLARAFAIVGAAGLIRYRARIKDPKDAGVMLVALAVGLATGSGLISIAVAATIFVIGVLWVLDSLEPPVRDRFDLKISTGQPTAHRPLIEGAFLHRDIGFELLGATHNQLHYEVTMPFEQKIRPVSSALKELDGEAASVEWEIKRQKDEPD